MKSLYQIPIILVFVIILFSCNSEEELPMSAFCDKNVVISQDIFNNRPDDDGTGRNSFEITKAEITNNCLVISILSGGCGGSTIKMVLVDSGGVSETAILQRDMKVFIDNSELCNAIVGKTVTFDIAPLRVQGNEILLNLEGWEDQLKYTY